MSACIPDWAAFLAGIALLAFSAFCVADAIKANKDKP